MSTVKITDLPSITTVHSNTANTVLVGVDIPTNVTGQLTLTALAAGLYSNNTLAVGNNYTILPNVVGQFTGNSATFTVTPYTMPFNGTYNDVIVINSDASNAPAYQVRTTIAVCSTTISGFRLSKISQWLGGT